MGLFGLIWSYTQLPNFLKSLMLNTYLLANSFDIGRNVVAPFLWKNKIQKIDFLVLTHPDPDHLNGLKFIARTFHVQELWDSGQTSDSPFFRELMSIVRQKDIRRIPLFRGDEPRIVKGVVVQALHPAKEACGARSASQRIKANNLSLVLRLGFGRQTFLFTGDIEKAAEAELIASGVELQSRVIKVPHHGSLTSSTPGFLRKVQPEIAVISAGQGSMSRSSNRRILKRYERLGCRIFRTDLHGAVTMETDGHTLEVRTFRKSSLKPLFPWIGAFWKPDRTTGNRALLRTYGRGDI
jgi:competence protein ComEC